MAARGGGVNKYPLARMLTVRELREDQASRLLRTRMAELDDAIAMWEAKKLEAAECLQSLLAKDREQMALTVGARLETGLTRSMQREMQAWRYRLQSAETEVAEALVLVEKAQEACDKARAVYQTRMKDKQKIVSHKEIWTTEAKKEAEAAEERELEDRSKPKNAT
jgi:type III secretion protein O